MESYRIDVRPLLDVIGGSATFADTIDIGDLVVGDELFRSRGPASFEVTISNAGEALVGFGSVSAPVHATCSRCLVEFCTTISGDIEGYWLRPGDVEPDEQDVTGCVDSDGSVDVSEAIHAALVVEAPFAPLHDETCAGLCPVCGVDRNLNACSCAAEPSPDNPFAALGELIDLQEDD